MILAFQSLRVGSVLVQFQYLFFGGIQMKNKVFSAAISLAVLGAAGSATAATNLVTNGDFETGTLAGWTVTNNISGSFYAIANGSNVPESGHPTDVNPGGGNFVAVSDQDNTSGQTLSQAFTTTGGSLTLTFDWFDNDHEGQFGTAIDGSEQTGRVDIMFATAGAFDVGAGVAQNLILGQGTFTNLGTTIPWQNASFTLTGLAAGNYVLRFGNGQCCFFQEFGVDNVVLLSAVPEPTTWMLMIAGFGLTGFAMRRRSTAMIA